jgi:hypothetical protein
VCVCVCVCADGRACIASLQLQRNFKTLNHFFDKVSRQDAASCVVHHRVVLQQVGVLLRAKPTALL